MLDRNRWTDLRNRLDFGLRNLTRFGLPVRAHHLDALQIPRFQNELIEFLSSVRWDLVITPSEPAWECLDVGAKNFAAGPVLDRVFHGLGATAYIRGIEIDAFRRSRDLRSRADYARHFVQKMRNASFHNMNFLDWWKPARGIVMLNPFVTFEPHLKWGLPSRTFAPAELFAHSRTLLQSTGGWLLTSSPTEHEREIVEGLARENKFQRLQQLVWSPGPQTLQRQPRLGALWKLDASIK